MVIRDIDKIEIPNHVWKQKKTITKDYPIVALDTETEKGSCIFIADSDGRFLIPNNIDILFKFLMYKNYQYSINFFYNIEFDTNAIIKLLPKEHQKNLAIYDETVYQDRDFNQYTVKIIPDKLLEISKDKHAVKFFDLAQFYGKQPLKTLAKKVDMEKYMLEDIKNLSKEKMLKDDEYLYEVKKRCVTDCVITQALGEKLNNAIKKFVKIRNYYSGASISRQLVLERLNDKFLKLPSLKMMDYALKSYNAGRFEILQRGYFPNMVERDINSAYPYEISNLYDCEGMYLHNQEYEPESTHSFFNCDLEIYDTVFSPFKFQLPNSQKELFNLTQNNKLSPNLLVYPVGKFKNQYMTKTDYETILEAGYPIKINSAVHLINPDAQKPFEYIEDLYYYRKDLQKGNTEKGIEKDEDLSNVIKTALNSIYGTTININSEKGLTKIESNDTKDFVIIDNEIWFAKNKSVAGSLFNPVYGVEIPAGTRNKIYRDFKKYEDKIICIATDGIKLTQDVSIKESSKLGGYDRSSLTEGILIGSGVYQFGTKTKFRGFDSKLTLKTLLKENKNSSIIKSIVNRVIGLKTCYRNNNIKIFNEETKEIESIPISLDDINAFVKINRDLNINFDTKRVWDRPFKNCLDVLENNIPSIPYEIEQ